MRETSHVGSIRKDKDNINIRGNEASFWKISQSTTVSEISIYRCSVHKVVSDPLQPHELQHTRLLCPPLSPRVCSNPCSVSWWYDLAPTHECYLTISSSSAPFSFCFQSFPASRSFLMSWLFVSGGQSIRASATVLPIDIQGWRPFGLTGLTSLQSKGLSRVFCSTTIRNISSLVLSLFDGPTLTSVHD